MRTFFLAAVLTAAFATAAASATDRPRVLAATFENDVNPVTQDYVNDQIERANEEGYDAVVILLDTPGGLGSSMEKIMRAELGSKVPVIVYVAPAGGGAASAGVFIAQAADVLAMAPQTAIGASTPVGQGGGNLPSDVRRKTINFYAGKLRTLARTHGRNAAWADRAVRKGASLSAEEALEQNVTDVVAPSLVALLDQIDGRKTKPKGFVLHTAGAEIERVDMSFWKKVLDTLINPELIVIFLSLGTLGLIVELWNPGLIFPGTVGAVSLILALFGLQVLPISAAGLLLMVLAFAFFGAEAFIPSHGALTVAGSVCFVLGALLLFDPAGESYEVSLTVALAIAGTLAALMAFVATKIVQVRRLPPTTGPDELIGQAGIVRQRLNPEGIVFVHGELWRARALEDEPLTVGEDVEVASVDGLSLRVRRASPQRS